MIESKQNPFFLSLSLFDLWLFSLLLLFFLVLERIGKMRKSPKYPLLQILFAMECIGFEWSQCLCIDNRERERERERDLELRILMSFRIM
jgi:hypothetical protein